MKTLQMPLKYLQDKGLLKKIVDLTNFYGDYYAFITDAFIENLLAKEIKETFNCHPESKYDIYTFDKECSEEELDILISKIDKEVEIIVGLGGGKSLDIAKLVSSRLNKPLIIVPTTASTDSATSAISVLYNKDGSLDRYVYHDKNPNFVIVDTDLIVKAPIRHLIAGMGETLSTYYEAKACYDSKSLNKLGGTPSLTTITISKLALDLILEKGLLAKVSAEQGIVNEALDQVIEANLFMSGFGFENSGLAAAHSIHNGLVELEETSNILHGEKVAFGTIVQLVLENRDIGEILRIIEFCKKVGLPHKLSDLGIDNRIKEKIQTVVNRATEPGESIHNLPFDVSKTMVFDAIMVADKLGNYE